MATLDKAAIEAYVQPAILLLVSAELLAELDSRVEAMEIHIDAGLCRGLNDWQVKIQCAINLPAMSAAAAEWYEFLRGWALRAVQVENNYARAEVTPSANFGLTNRRPTLAEITISGTWLPLHMRSARIPPREAD